MVETSPAPAWARLSKSGGMRLWRCSFSRAAFSSRLPVPERAQVSAPYVFTVRAFAG